MLWSLFMPRKDVPVWKQETRLVSIAVSGKRKGSIILFSLSCLSFVGAAVVIGLYLMIPLTLMLDPFHDWWAQLLGAGCIFFFIEGLIGITLLKIAQVAPGKKHVSPSVQTLPVNYEKTVYLPLIQINPLDELEPSTQLLSGEGLATQFLGYKDLPLIDKNYLEGLYAQKVDLLPTLKQVAYSIQGNNKVDQNLNGKDSALEEDGNHLSANA
jgi:hypothetical protein